VDVRLFFIKVMVLALLALGFLGSCNQKSSSPSNDPTNNFSNPFADGLTTNFITVSSQSRKYLVHKPAGLSKPQAVIVVLHGGGGTGVDVANYGQHPLSVFRTVADAHGVMAIYPEGSLDAQGNPGWNDCRDDSVSGSSGSDLAFLNQLILKLTQDLQLTRSKIFLAGTSNGGVMAYAYAFNFPDTLRAIAVSSANLPAVPKVGACTTGPGTALPVLITHGTTDPAMPVNGGCVANLGGQCNRGTVLSQQQTLDFWLNLNGLQGISPTVSVINNDSSDQGAADKHIYAGNNPVFWYRLNGAGHPVPSTSVATAYSPASGYQNRDIEFAEESWGFFSTLLQ
jgi:polyhydroxybutyrate depolymerase